MAVSVNWLTKVITIPKADLTFISGTLYALDTEALRLEFHALLDDPVGMPFLDIFRHNTTVTIAGTVYARSIEIINGYQLEFEDGQYAVRLDGSNNNYFDEGIISRNQVSVIPTNSAGLVVISTSAGSDECHLEVAYDDTSNVFWFGGWLERGGVISTTVTSFSVSVYLPSGVFLFTLAGTGPDAQEHFEAGRIGTTLYGDTAYYAVVTAVDALGTVVTQRGIPTSL